jgi:hypothetical protein
MEFLIQALRSLPVVATSSYAFLAYLAVVLAWVIIAWKVRRNRTLLENLEKFPEPDRIKIVRDEMGITLKTGLSPEQWIRTRIHKYFFIGFLVTAIVILFIFLVSAFASRQGKVSVDVTAPEENVNPSPNGHADMMNKSDSTGVNLESTVSASAAVPELIHYVYSSSGDLITIRPNATFLKVRAKGGPVLEGYPNPENSSENPFSWLAVQKYTPTVSVKVVNNSSQTVYISQAVLKVNSSKVNSNPVLFFLSYHGPQFGIDNEGWGRVINPRLSFGFADASLCAVPEGWGEEEFTKDLPSFFENTTVEIEDVLPEAYKVADPRVGKTTCLFGTLSYTTELNQRRSIKAKVPIHIGGPRKFDGYGVSKGDAVYSVYLPPGESNYEKHVSIAQVLKPGEGDHFSIKLHTTKSCAFDIDLSLRTTEGGEISRKRIALEVFVPRSAKTSK